MRERKSISINYFRNVNRNLVQKSEHASTCLEIKSKKKLTNKRTLEWTIFENFKNMN